MLVIRSTKISVIITFLLVTEQNNQESYNNNCLRYLGSSFILMKRSARKGLKVFD